MSPSRNQFAPGRAASLLAPMLLGIAGCASGISNYVANPGNAIFSLVAAVRTTDTNGQLQVRAVTPTGAAAAVNWSVLRGGNDPAIGQGSIDPRGVYTPPASLTHGSVEVEIQAQLRSDPTKVATEILEITPGFLQPLTPESSALEAGASVPVTAQLAEVGGGTIDWTLATAPSGGKRLGSAYGSVVQTNCQHSQQNYTVCTAVYTAPAALPSTASVNGSAARQDVYVIATVSGANGPGQTLHVLLNGAGISSTPLVNQSAQTSLIQLGASGGNNNDADTSNGSGATFVNDCCGGTLGALVRDQTGSQYILSNNHVLAESDQAGIGDTIVQPGLIDGNCDQNAGRPVAWLRFAVPLANAQSDVDAALAEVNAGAVDPNGSILQLGAPGSGPNNGLGSAIGAGAPAAGLGEAISPALFGPDSTPLQVAKSGRTTGLTCSTIDAINLSIEVDYFKDCAETQPYYRKTFANQIGIGGDGFSDSGDSGALIVDAANAQPLGLFFAGGTDDRGGGFSVASPIQEVLAELDAQAGRQFSVVGGSEHPVSCMNYDAKVPAVTLPEALRKRAETAIRKNAAALVNPLNGVLDLAAAASADAPGEAAVLVYVDASKDNVPVPQTIGGLRSMIIETNQSSILNGTAPQSPTLVAGIHLPAAALQQAQSIQQANAKRLLADPAIFGVGVTQSRDNPAEAALLLLVDMARTPRATPAVIGGLRVRYVTMHRFHVTRSKHAGAAHPSTCAVKSLMGKSAPASFDPSRSAPLPLP